MQEVFIQPYTFIKYLKRLESSRKFSLHKRTNWGAPSLGPYEYKWNDKVVPVAEGGTETTTVRYIENYKNVLPDIRDQLNVEAEAVQIILTGIDNDIYSTVHACPNVCEMWKAIESLKQGESINVQDLETNLYWEFGKFTSRDGESLESYYSRYLTVWFIAILGYLASFRGLPIEFPFVYEHEPSYNQNYNDNYYPHESPSFLCCDNYRESHETFQCQPMDHNVDFSGSNQIQTQQYPEVHPPSQEISDEVFQAKGDLMKSIQTFLKEFNYIPFGEKPKILLQAWDKFFTIQRAQPEDSNELFQKLIEDLKELAEYKEFLENSFNEIATSNQEKEKPPQDSDIRQLIKEECSIEICAEQKQNMENTILDLIGICRQKELLCMHDNVDDLIESALNSKLLSINSNSQRLDKKEQEVRNVMEQPVKRGTRIEKSLQKFKVIHKSSISLKNTSQISPVHAVAPNLSTKEPEYSSSMGYEHTNTTSETESDEIIKSGVEELVPILNENEVTSEDKKEYDDFEDIEYLEASLPDPDIVNVEEENDVNVEEEERLINVVKNDISNDSSNDPLLEEADLLLASDNSIPQGIENFSYDSKGDIRFLKELLIDDSILFPNNELSGSDFDNPSVPRPPPEPRDAEFDFKEEISVVMNDKDELECLDSRDEFDVSTNDENGDYFPFMFVIRIFLPYLICSKMFLSLLSAESEDTIFDAGISV
nr:hypothetical protein [Tanacetum cinerariifolium]